ncbi:MAG: hypothetical protein R3C97_12515 [Geminicoccaceae bacterium]
MQGTEKLGMTGIAGLGIVVLGILALLVGGFPALIYVGLILTLVALLVLLGLCSSDAV